MARRKNRSRSKISRLPPEIRSTVDAMIQATADFTYTDIQEYLAEQGVEISTSAIGTYARSLMDSLEALTVAQETMRAMMETAAKVPEVVELDKLLREMNAMTKAVAYKQRIDLQNKTDAQTAADELKAQFFSALGTEHPDLYRQLVQILERKTKEAGA